MAKEQFFCPYAALLEAPLALPEALALDDGAGQDAAVPVPLA